MKDDSEHIINEKLVRRYLNGDEESLKLLIKRFHPKLKGVVYRQIHQKEPVDDIVQESWYAIINNLAELKHQIGFEAWALTIARRKAIDWIREQQLSRRKMEDLRQEPEGNQEEQADENSRKLSEISRKIQELPRAQQMVLIMFYKDNLTIKEIAKVLDVSAGTVKSRLFHGREFLKASLTETK